MKNEAKQIVKKIILEISKEEGVELLKKQNSAEIITFAADDYHLFMNLGLLQLQSGITLNETGLQMMMFLDPILVTNQTKEMVALFLNQMNVLTHGLGHFSLDMETKDVEYSLRVSELYIMQCAEELKKQMFEIPVSFFRDMQRPLIKLIEGKWTLEKANTYLEKIFENGYVDEEVF